MSRIAARFAEMNGRAAFVPFITAGDPDFDTSLAILNALPGAGADLIELGMPFTDPMADGPAVQASSLRALKTGATMARTLELVKEFRKRDSKTPIVLMGYYNPIHAIGAADFIKQIAAAGVDGLIVVDLPPEEDAVLLEPAKAAGIDMVRLVTPTTHEARLAKVLQGASGFLYYVSIAGVTGTKSFAGAEVKAAVARIRKATRLPVAVGFGIRTPAQAGEIARIADAAVVGSAIVTVIGEHQGAGKDKIVAKVTELCRALADSTHAAAGDKVQA
ncbi:MAG TPA: tryptophan synthase subunit alpha [Rhizomicrobium sp.]|jgi:tryptophan synthase alpha chain|nr:tryptophan synthase subunit alpha [Rhizomicrobium sp.]